MRPDRMLDEARSKDPENDGHTFSMKPSDSLSSNVLVLRCDECDHMWDMVTGDKPMVIDSDCDLCLGTHVSLRVKRGTWVKLYGRLG